MTNDARYRKLPGRRGLFGGASLWLGPDHLLSVKSVRFAHAPRFLAVNLRPHLTWVLRSVAILCVVARSKMGHP